MDIHLRSLFAARLLSRRLLPPDNQPLFVLADARYLPFAPDSFTGVFSYSVLQHFSKTDAALILSEVQRVMRPLAKSLVQMPNRAGVKSIGSLMLRGFSEGSEFDVRYYSIGDLLRLFSERIGPSEWFVDCFFGLNIHSRDRKLVPLTKRWIVDLAEAVLRASSRYPPLGRVCDSVFIRSTKR